MPQGTKYSLVKPIDCEDAPTPNPAIGNRFLVGILERHSHRVRLINFLKASRDSFSPLCDGLIMDSDDTVDPNRQNNK